jgi:hypothetical protein
VVDRVELLQFALDQVPEVLIGSVSARTRKLEHHQLAA